MYYSNQITKLFYTAGTLNTTLFGKLQEESLKKQDYVAFEIRNYTFFLFQKKSSIPKEWNATLLNSVHSGGFAATVLLVLVRGVANFSKLQVDIAV